MGDDGIPVLRKMEIVCCGLTYFNVSKEGRGLCNVPRVHECVREARRETPTVLVDDAICARVISCTA
jgi:hypothetical protein